METSISNVDTTANLKAEIKLLEASLKKEKTNRENEEAKYRVLEGSVTKLEIEKVKRNNNLSDKQRIVYELQSQVYKLTEELNVLKNKQKFQVQLFSNHDGEVMREALVALDKAIRSQGTDHEFEVIRCTKTSEIRTDIPALILTIATHDIAQRIFGTLKGISVSDNTAVVVVHLKNESALPVLPTDRVISWKEFGTLAGIHDIGFMKEKGLYKCRFNEANVISITNFIRRKGEKIQLTK